MSAASDGSRKTRVIMTDVRDSVFNVHDQAGRPELIYPLFYAKF